MWIILLFVLGIILILPLLLLFSINSIKSDIADIKKEHAKLKGEISKIKAKLNNTPKEENQEINQEDISIKQVLNTNVINEDIIKDNNQNFNIQCELKKLEEIEKRIDNYTTTQNITETDSQNKVSSDFEKMFLGNIFNKIGAVALIIGIGIFVKMISAYIDITPQMQIFFAYFASILSIFGGLYLYKKDSKIYGEIFNGIGIAGILISTFAGIAFYKLIPAQSGVFIGLAVVVFSYILAQKFKSFSTIVLGIFGGYFNLYFINHNVGVEFLFVYLILINLMAVVYVNQNPNKTVLNIANLFLTTFSITILSMSSKQDISLYYPISLWLLYFVNDFISIVKNKYSSNLEILNWLNFASLVWFVNYILHFENKTQIGTTLIVFAFIYIIAQIIINKYNSQNKRIYSQNALLAILSSTYLLAEGITRPIVFSFEALVLSYLYYIFNHKEFKNYSCAFVCACVLAVTFLQDILFSQIHGVHPQRLLLFSLCSGFVGLGGYLMSKKDKKLAEIFYLISLTLVYLYFVFEINSIYGLNDCKFFLNIIICAIYSINSHVLFKRTQNNLFRTASNLIYTIGAISLLISALNTTYNDEALMMPFVNLGFASFLAMICATIIFAVDRKSNILKYFASLLGAITIYIESCKLAEFIYSENIAIFGSVGLILYGGAIILFGIYNNTKWLQKTGIWVILFSILKILLFDLSGIDPIFKLIAFIVLGSCLMIVSYYYSKSGKNIRK